MVALRTTRDRPTGDPRKIHERAAAGEQRGNLNNRIVYKKEYRCTGWYIGTLAMECLLLKHYALHVVGVSVADDE